jgi:quercetin dioxygenase-like cupin family protein
MAEMQTANINEVEKVKTGHGMTKFLIKNHKGEGANVMVRYWGPETNIPVHSHPFDEMWYVIEGEVEFGDITYGIGSVVYIPAGVKYGPTRAPKGVALLRYSEDADR